MTHVRPADNSFQVQNMTRTQYYTSEGLYILACGDKKYPQTIHMSNGATITGVMTRSDNGIWVDVVAPNGTSARLDANKIEWFDAAGNPFPTSNDTDPDYFGTPVTLS